MCAPLGLKGPRPKLQGTSGQWYHVHADMFRRDDIPVGAGQGDQCWRCTKEAGQVPWPVLRMTAWAFPTATMRTRDARGQWWGPVLQLQKEDDGVAVSFWITDTGRPEEEAPIVPVGHKCGERARRIRLTVHGLPADKVWYRVQVQAYLEQGPGEEGQGMVSRGSGEERLERQDRQ